VGGPSLAQVSPSLPCDRKNDKFLQQQLLAVAFSFFGDRFGDRATDFPAGMSAIRCHCGAARAHRDLSTCPDRAVGLYWTDSLTIVLRSTNIVSSVGAGKRVGEGPSK
jgi:hypothetical protein